MGTEPHHLLTRHRLGHLEGIAVGSAPHRLHHVPEVEPTLAEVRVAPVGDEEQDAAHTTIPAHTTRVQRALAHERHMPPAPASRTRSADASRLVTRSRLGRENARSIRRVAPRRSRPSAQRDGRRSIASAQAVSNGAGGRFPG